MGAPGVLRILGRFLGVLTLLAVTISLATSEPGRVEKLPKRTAAELSGEWNKLPPQEQREVEKRLSEVETRFKGMRSTAEVAEKRVREILDAVRTPDGFDEAARAALSLPADSSPRPASPFLTDSVSSIVRDLRDASGIVPEQQEQRKLVILDVKRRNRRLSVAARSPIDLFFEWAGLPALSGPKLQDVGSIADLDAVTAGASAVVHRGDDLPREWLDHLKEKRDYLRNSEHSPKRSPGDYTQAVQALERRAEPGRVRILSALPQARERKALIRELGRMYLGTDEVEAWERLQHELDSVQTETPFQIEAGTKEAFIQELREGANDYIVLVAHFADGKLHFPGGPTMTTRELSAIQRKEAPDRTVILISCNAGTVNEPLKSPGEIVIEGKLAVNVVARPDPVSALEVPGLLRDFLIERKTIKEVFVSQGYYPMTKIMPRLPGRGVEIADPFLAQARIAWFDFGDILKRPWRE